MEPITTTDDVRFYVYEVKKESKGFNDETPSAYWYVIKLIQVGNDTFRFELTLVEPESFKETVENGIETFSSQVKLEARRNISIDETTLPTRTLSFNTTFLPFPIAEFFLEPELVKNNL